MSDNTIFIKNEDEYNDYKIKYNIGQQRKIHVKFNCSCCNKLSEKTLIYLKFPFKCTKCNNKNSVEKRKITNRERYGCDSPLQNPNIQNKIKETCLKKYGHENVFQSDEIKEKIKQTCKERYGVEYYQQTDDFKIKYTNTCLEKYGVKSPLQNNEIKEKLKMTCLNKYGHENILQSPEIREKIKNTIYEKYGVDHISQSNIIKKKKIETCKSHYGVSYPGQSPEIMEKTRQSNLLKYGYEYTAQVPEIIQKMNDTETYNRLKKYNNFLSQYNLSITRKNKDRIYFKCNICNNEFDYDITYFFVLLKTLSYNATICPTCLNKNIPGISAKEIELLMFIKQIYNGIIIEHDRTVLNGKELDIYLPELNIAFEFDGKYWHADPNIYKPTDIILNQTAAEIWERDNQKDILCEQANIQLIRIKENDWINNNEKEKYRITNIIYSSLASAQ